MRLIQKFQDSGKVKWKPTEIHKPNYAEDQNAWIYEKILSGEEGPKTFPQWYPEGNPLYTSAQQGVDFADNYFSSPGYLSRFADLGHYRNYNNEYDSNAEQRQIYNSIFGTNYNGNRILKYMWNRPYSWSSYTPAVNGLKIGINYGNRDWGDSADYKDVVYWPKETTFMTAAHETGHGKHATSKDPDGFTKEELELMSKAEPAELKSLQNPLEDPEYARNHKPFNAYINDAIMKRPRQYIDIFTEPQEVGIEQNPYQDSYWYVDPRITKKQDETMWQEILDSEKDILKDSVEKFFTQHDSLPEEIDAMRTELLAGLASEGIYDARFTKKDGTFNPITKEQLKRYMYTKSYQAFPRLINMYRNNLDALVDLLNMTYK